jgi:hypothetical protein
MLVFPVMIKFVLSSVSTLSLLASALLLWQSDFFPEQLPRSVATWVLAFFSLFHEPFTALTIYGLTLMVVMGSWFITELLLSFIYSIAAAALSFLCLVGYLSVHYQPLQHWLQGLAGQG